MAIKPMLFNTEMVQALLEGRKTVTRQVIKPQPEGRPVLMGPDSCWPGYFAIQGTETVVRPPFQIGDILWVRETWSPVNVRPKRYIYKADVARRIGEGVGLPLCWHPSIHMPKEAARIFLRVTGVRAERLQKITYNEAIREGADRGRALNNFEWIWNHTTKAADLPAYGWAANPWVWVIKFERCEKPEGWPC